MGDNGKEKGNYYSIMGYILGLYGDNGKENGNYYNGESNGKEHENEMETGIVMGSCKGHVGFWGLQ